MRHCQNSFVSLFSNRWSLCSAVSPSFRLWWEEDGERKKQMLIMTMMNGTFSGQMCCFLSRQCFPCQCKSVVTQIRSLNPNTYTTLQPITHPFTPCELWSPRPTKGSKRLSGESKTKLNTPMNK